MKDCFQARIALLFGLIFLTPLQAQEVFERDGFRITLPAGWRNLLDENLPTGVIRGPQDRRLILSATDDAGSTMLVTQMGEVPVEDPLRAAQLLRRSLEGRAAIRPGTPKFAAPDTVKIAGRRCGRVRMSLSGEYGQFESTMVLIPNGTSSIELSLFRDPEIAQDAPRDFQSILDSIELETGASRDGWSQRLGELAFYGVIAVALAVAIWLRGRQKRRRGLQAIDAPSRIRLD